MLERGGRGMVRRLTGQAGGGAGHRQGRLVDMANPSSGTGQKLALKVEPSPTPCSCDGLAAAAAAIHSNLESSGCRFSYWKLGFCVGRLPCANPHENRSSIQWSRGPARRIREGATRARVRPGRQEGSGRGGEQRRGRRRTQRGCGEGEKPGQGVRRAEEAAGAEPITHNSTFHRRGRRRCRKER